MEPLNKFQPNYYLKDSQYSVTSRQSVAQQGVTDLIISQRSESGRRFEGVYTQPESLHEYGTLSRAEKKEGFYNYSLPRTADACYNIQFVFREGEECDVFLDGQNITNKNTFTKNHPLYLVNVELSEIIFKTKYKLDDILVNLIFLDDEERVQLYDRNYTTTVNAYFTVFYCQGFLNLFKNEHVLELHFVAKRIQKWYRKNSLIQQMKMYRLQCQDELVYLPPFGTFPGGIEYQNALERFDTLKKKWV